MERLRRRLRGKRRTRRQEEEKNGQKTREVGSMHNLDRTAEREDDVLTHTIQIYNLRGGRRERKSAPAQSDVNEEDEEERSMRTTQASAPVEAEARARTRGSMREHTHL